MKVVRGQWAYPRMKQATIRGLRAALLVVLMLGAACERPPAAPASTQPSAVTQPVAPIQRSAETQPARRVHRIVAYYFHKTIRCPECLAIEKQSKEAFDNRYFDALADGRLEWRPTNTEEPANRRFEQDFELVNQALILAEVDGEAVLRWKKLDRTWELVDKPGEFEDYVSAELAAFAGW